MNQTKKRLNVLRGTFLVTLILLVIQYIFGMIVNLYVQFPSTLIGGKAVWGWAMSSTLVVPIHALLGTVLLIAAIVALVLSIRIRRVPELLTSVLGFVMIVFAWLSGILFLSFGQQNGVSLQMAIGFIGAVIAYGVGCYTARPTYRNSKNTTQEARVRERETSLTAR